MPYIKKEDRLQFDKALDTLPPMKVKGELEYCIYKLMKRYMSDKPIKYTTLHDTVYGAMHCADEFRRRNLDVREDAAREENGDVL
jgi:hypothetical protein